MKRILLLSIFLLSFLSLFACMQTPPGEQPPADDEFEVTFISENDCASVAANPIVVEKGGKAVFRVTLKPTAVFRSTSEGEYDPETRVLTISNVTKNTRVRFLAEDVGYDTTGKYYLTLVGSSKDSVSHSDPEASIQPGTQITAVAGDMNASFVGWSAFAPIASGGTKLSEERTFTFDLSPDLVRENRLILYPNYTEANVYYYDPNGGSMNMLSRNIMGGTPYAASKEGSCLRVALSENEMKDLGCASLFYDDGSFYRNGYVLLEYNTKADGTGDGYSLGSKFPMNSDQKVLYCIWAEVEADEKFSYESFSFPIPEGIDSSNVPGWKSSGVRILSYLGNAETVVIPETLGGKPVISIASGAFDHCSNMKTLVFSKNLLKVEDGAFTNLSKLDTVYYSDSIYDIGNGVLDASGYQTLKHFIVNATTPPRFSTRDGAFARKFCRLLANSDQPRIIMIAGSSARQGFSTPFLQNLLNGDYAVINFGTTRTTQGFIYLEAMQNYAKEDDIILYAPENSAYMMGEGTLYWKTLRDMEGMYNVFRYIDISGYDNVFGAFAEFNSGIAEVPGVDSCYSPRYKMAPQTYEQILNATGDNVYGDYQHYRRSEYRSDCLTAFQDAYVITLNKRFKSRLDFGWDNSIEDYWKNDDWTDPTDEAWCNIDDEYYVTNMNRAISAAKSTGAKVYFSFCPVDASRLCPEALADIDAWCSDYEDMITETFDFDGILGNAKDYIYNHEYFYDNAFHPNDYGRTYRTYQVYLDLCDLLSISSKNPIYYVDWNDPELEGITSLLIALSVQYQGCLFEIDPIMGIPSDTPIYPAFAD